LSIENLDFNLIYSKDLYNIQQLELKL